LEVMRVRVGAEHAHTDHVTCPCHDAICHSVGRTAIARALPSLYALSVASGPASSELRSTCGRPLCALLPRPQMAGARSVLAPHVIATG
jgi:hypothetical protein